MESRKYQLQKQILEALQDKDEDLYSLLKSQWAHRYGVESLEELNKLDFNQQEYQNANNEDKARSSVEDKYSHPEVKPLIPLPRKPKYSYLSKWLLRK